MKSVAEKRSPSLFVAAATSIGTSIEWYDFYIYGCAAALLDAIEESETSTR